MAAGKNGRTKESLVRDKENVNLMAKSVKAHDVGECLIDLREILDGETHVGWHELAKDGLTFFEDGPCAAKYRGRIQGLNSIQFIESSKKYSRKT